MRAFDGFSAAPAEFLLPAEGADMAKWAVIACDQHTSEPEYWQAAQAARESAPSALDMIYPEAWLSRGEERESLVNAAMREYRKTVLTRRVEGFILVGRETSDGLRTGLLAAIDLERYDFSPDSRSAVRPTEATVPERVPPRVRIRRQAPLETGHALLLADDPGDILIGPLWEERERLEPLYDFELMLGGGRIRGYRVGEERYPAVREALCALREAGGGLDFAVGDGNHSLAAAAAFWGEIKPSLSPEERETHPARWAMAEITNLRAPSLRFHPIHRALFGPCEGLADDLRLWLARRGMALAPGADFSLNGQPFGIQNASCPLAVGVLQPFLDEWLSGRSGVSIDYIHGDGALSALRAKGAATIALSAMDKAALFPSVRERPLPRKTFSMGEARDKRYYVEARAIRP